MAKGDAQLQGTRKGRKKQADPPAYVEKEKKKQPVAEEAKPELKSILKKPADTKKRKQEESGMRLPICSAREKAFAKQESHHI
jgi:hypothetical protein